MSAAPPAPPRQSPSHAPPTPDDKLHRLLTELREAVIRIERDRPNAGADLNRIGRPKA